MTKLERDHVRVELAAFLELKINKQKPPHYLCVEGDLQKL